MFEIEGTDCWVQHHNSEPCAQDRAGIFGVEIIMWHNEDGSPVKGVQTTPLCEKHRAQAEEDGVLRVLVD